MKTQTIINIVFAVAFVGYVVSQLNPTFDTITCKEWRVVDKHGMVRIDAAANAADGLASVQVIDKDGMVRITAATLANGLASVQWLDKDEKMRIGAGTQADGTVVLPTTDLTPPKKP